MLIACEKCATTYVLDERLIPAAGAPVQCTRCGHVFTARPGTPAPVDPAALSDTPHPRSTMQFGKGAEKPAAPAGNRTMVFGAAGGEAPGAKAPAKHTMMFGAAPPEGPAAKAAPKSSTMMFGAVPPAAPEAKLPAKNATMMFGAAPAVAPVQPPADPPPNRTMMFGAVDAPSPATLPNRPNAQTMVFGSAPVPQPTEEAEPTAPVSRTMMFGLPTADRPNVEPVAPAPGTGKLSERTVRIGPEELERMMAEHNALAERERAGEMTPPEGAPATSQKTQMFAMSDIRPPEAATPLEGTPAVESAEQVQRRHDRTAMFAMSPETAPAPEHSNVRFDPSLLETLPPDGPAPKLRAPIHFGAEQGAARPDLLAPLEQTTNPELMATTLPNLPNLPRQNLTGRREPALAVDESGGSGDDAALVLLQQVKRRNRLALIIVALAILGVASAVGWKLFGGKLFGKAVPLEAMQRVESGLAELRNDDTASKASAVKTLLGVVKDQPAFVDAHAGLVTALTLQLDDLQQRAKRLDKAAEERNGRILRYGKEKSPADWEARAAALVTEVGAIKKDYDPLVEQARELEGRLREAYKAMQVAASQGGELNRQAELALIRAQALYHAYGGTDEALKLTRRYQSKAGDQSDGWIDLVDAEYAANTRASPDLVEAAQKQLAALRERDSSFFRTYVLSARLHLQSKHYDEAEAQLANVSALKPKHDIANELSQWVTRIKAEQAVKEKDRIPPVAPQ